MEEERENSYEREEIRQKGGTEIRISNKIVITFMAVFAMFLFMLCKILGHFGVGSPTFIGIMSIFIYGLSLGGLIWAYLKDRRTSPEFWLNVVVFGLAIFLL